MEKFINKLLLLVVVFFLIMFLGIWIFNHVYSWAGVAIILVGIYFGIKTLIKIINNFKPKN